MNSQFGRLSAAQSGTAAQDAPKSSDPQTRKLRPSKIGGVGILGSSNPLESPLCLGYDGAQKPIPLIQALP